uniref:Uncharacterized protein n=1 Tax=Melanopsichium pennsylvanicum 4 TaxID=1398559 RepID=A0A077QU07_9BASI|nr:putative protein [Melanopsichium pennsylvanicum 4]
MLDLNSSAPFKATHITPSLIAEYISSNRLSDAIELLEQRVNVHPYKSQPELHTTLGMLYLFVGIQTLFDNNDCSSSGAAQSQGESSVDSGVDVRHLDRTNRNKARACFEAAIQASATWKRSEITKRQRVYGMHRKSVDDVEKRLRKRETLWGKDVLVEDDQNAWPTTEHRDLKRIRAKLEGSPPTANDRDGDANDNSDLDSSASGSVYAESDAQSSLASEQEPEEDHDQRGRSQSRRAASSEPNNLPEEVGEAEEALPRTRGQRAWAQTFQT